MFARRERFETKTDDEIRLMRRAGLVVADTLQMLSERAVAGSTTGDLDGWAEAHIRAAGARPSFAEVPGYRHTLCVSVNDEVVHGIPGERVLREGDLVSIDCGAVLDGWHGDAAITLVVGGRTAARPEDLILMDATEDALWSAIAALRVGGRLDSAGGGVEDALAAAQEAARATGAHLDFGIVEGYEGHGIGREMHMDPGVPNYRVRGRSPKVPSGATLAIEPMVTLGTGRTSELADGWTVVTVDGSHAAHWEHTVAITEKGAWVLTAPDGGQERLLAMGASYGPLE